MTDKDKEALNDRFSGYTLPTIDLEAGFTAYQVPVHPYFFNQPLEWTKNAYTKYHTTGPQALGGDFPMSKSGYSSGGNVGSSSGTEISGSSGSSEYIIRGKKDVNGEGDIGGPRTDLLPF